MYPLTVLECDECAVWNEFKELLTEFFYLFCAVHLTEIVVMGNKDLASYFRSDLAFDSACAMGCIIAISGLAALQSATCSAVGSPP